MGKVVAFAFVLITVLILFSIALAVSFSPAAAEFQVIRIRDDGSVDPATAPIQRDEMCTRLRVMFTRQLLWIGIIL
jgi:hypothetical protein